MREKADPAVATAHQAPAQFGMVPQNRPQRDLILTNKRSGLIVPVPVWPKSVNLLEGYEKKARFCVIMRIVFSMSSSYLLNAKSSRGGARIFCAPARKIKTPIPPIRPSVLRYAFLLLRPIHSASLRAFSQLKRLLGKKNRHDKSWPKTQPFLLPSSGGI